jgi:hypothetical protein
VPTPEEYARIAKGPQTPQERIWWDRYSHDKLEPWRKHCDPLADDCTALITRSSPARMLQQVEARAATEGGVFRQFMEETARVPAWVDFEELERGRRIFRRFAGLQGVILLCSSLVEGYSLYNPAQVLVATGRLQKDVSKRIYETGLMLHNIVGEQGLRPGGLGHRTCLEVRLLHSAVRQHLWGGGRWDSASLGEPINQEDLAATVLGFDFMVVRGLRKLGMTISDHEHRLMHYYWRYVGHLLGVDDALLTVTPEEQQVFALQMVTHLYRPTEHGEQLMKALLTNMAHKPPFGFSADFLFAMAAFLGGKVLEKDFHLEHSVRAKAEVAAFVATTRLFGAGENRAPSLVRNLMADRFHRYRRQNIVDGLGGKNATLAFSGID